MVVPVPVSEMFPRPWEPPTAPVKVTPFVPTEVVKLRAAELSLSTVLLKVIKLLVVVKISVYTDIKECLRTTRSSPL